MSNVYNVYNVYNVCNVQCLRNMTIQTYTLTLYYRIKLNLNDKVGKIALVENLISNQFQPLSFV